MRRAHVFAQPAKTQRQDPRSQVRHRAPGQDHEPCVVGNEVQAAKLLLGKPTDPPVPGLELERAGVPAHQREPVLAQDCNVAKAASHQSPERQIVVRGHQRIPALAFARARGGAHRDLAQSLSNRVEHCLRRSQRVCATVSRPQDGLSRGETRLMYQQHDMKPRSALGPESVSSFHRNQCPVSSGIGVQFAPEYASRACTAPRGRRLRREGGSSNSSSKTARSRSREGPGPISRREPWSRARKRSGSFGATRTRGSCGNSKRSTREKEAVWPRKRL